MVLKKALTSTVSARRKTGPYAKATLSGTWSLPAGATNIKGGIARVYTNGDENFTKYDIYNNGIKKVATIKTINAKYSFCLTMNSVDTGLDMYSVTYVTFTFDGETFTSISDEIAYCPVLA